MSAEEKDKGFVTKDRRILKEENLDDQPTASEGTDDAPESQATEPPDGESPEAKQASADMPLPKINFATFIASLNASALVNLGAIADPATGKEEKNLPIAKQTVDIISMLQEKTKGNLTKEEESILKNVLYDLRMMYVKAKS